MRHPILTLIRREWLEHRSSFFILPVLMIAGLTLIALVALIKLHIHLDPDVSFEGFSFLEFKTYTGLWQAPFYFTAFMVAVYYSSQCFYEEKVERSILFWQSLPTPEWQTVLAKALTALFIIPTCFLLCLTAGELLNTFLLSMGAHLLHAAWLELWYPSAILKDALLTALNLYTNLLWAAPILAYSMLVSAYVKKSPIIHALVPLILFIIFEQAVFNQSSWTGTVFWHLSHALDAPSQSIETLLQELKEPALYIGLAISAGLLTLTAWVRNRYHDRV